MDTVLYFKNIDNAPARRKLLGFGDFARQEGWNIQIVPPNPSALAGLLDFWHPVGCVVNSASGWNNFSGADFAETPVVFIDRPPTALRPCDSYVYHDATETVRLAMRELLVSPSASYAYVSWPVDHDWNRERLDEFRAILGLHGRTGRVFTPACPLDDAMRLSRELAAWLAELPHPTAVLAAADPMGLQVLAACRLAGLHVPDEVSVIGIDNDEDICETSIPALSSVSPDHRLAGWRAGEILKRLIETRQTAPMRETYGHVSFVRRGSTLRLKRKDGKVVEALEHIRRHAGEGLSAAEVFALFDCSRRNAEIRFRTAYGQSVMRAIHARRLEIAKELLKSHGDLTFVAHNSGYSSAAALSHFFRKETGLSPRAWRTRLG